jgi:hypothetical protein
MAMEKEPNPVSKAYEYLHTNPDFLGDSELDVPDFEFTALDTFAVPKSLVENEEKFLEWFEPRFFKLDDAGVKEFNGLCQEALEIISEHKYLLSPRKGKDFPISHSVVQRVSSGFKDLSEIRNFFDKVSLDDSKVNPREFFRPHRGSDKGAIRLSICRILTFARLLDGVRKSQNLEAFIENSRYVLGRTKETKKEPGILSSLLLSGNLEILDKPNGKMHILDWLEKAQVFRRCNITLGGSNRKMHYIPEVHINLKGGERAFMKIARDPKSEFDPLDDFLRLRFIYDDNEDLSTMIDLLYDLQEEAKSKNDPITKIEIRARNYFSKDDLEQYLPNKIGKREETEEDQNESETFEKQGQEVEASRLKKRLIKEKRGSDFIDQVIIYKNPGSGKNYKGITVKIYLYNPESEEKERGEGRPFFGFEVQIIRKGELKANEEIERHSSHFLFEMRQAAELISRENGSLNKNEFARLLKEYLFKKKTEELPLVLLGRAKYKDEGKSKSLEINFEGTLDEKADLMFDFFVAEGTLRHVAPNFPTEGIPKRETRMNSGLYLHKEIVTRTLESLGYKKKEEKKK